MTKNFEADKMPDVGNEQGSTQVDYDPFADADELQKVVLSTEAQQEIWLSVQLVEEASCAFNESVTLQFSGAFDTAAIKKSLEYVVQRHEALRSTFTNDGSQLCVAESVDFEVEFVAGDASTYESIKHREVNNEFDIENGPLFRACVIEESAESFYLLLTAHHIICDGWSLAIIINDIALAYNAYHAGDVPKQDKAFAFSDYVEENQKQLEGNSDEAFWLDLFRGAIPDYDLPIDKPRPEFRSFKSKRFDLSVDLDLMEKVKKVSTSNGCSLTATMLAAYYVCLQRWSGEDELVIGIPAASQPSYAPESLVGHCVNMLPILTTVDHEVSFSDFMIAVRDRVLDSYENQNCTFGSLLKKLPVKRNPSRIPLVPTIFNVDQGIQGGQLGFSDVDVSFESNPRDFENFEIFINASDYGDRFIIECQYNTDLFSLDSIKNRLNEYVCVLEGIVESPNSKLCDLPLITATQRQTIIDENKSTFIDMEDQLFVSDKVSEVAKLCSDKTAVFCGEESLTYQQLDEDSNRIANFLLSKGLSSGGLVGLCVDRSVGMLTTLLGILKIGCAYVPLDPEYPEDRLAFMVDDAELKFLIVQSKYSKILPEVSTTFCFDELMSDSAKQVSELPAQAISDQNLAYMIYTSGSTGKPKGVMVHRRAVTNFLNSMSMTPGLNSEDTLLAVTTLSFDIAVLELYLPLITGATLVIAKRDEATDGRRLLEVIKSHDVSCMQATPATWRALIGSGWSSENSLKVLCGGEALPKDLAKELCERSSELWNMYGPTETTVWSTCKKIEDPNASISLGDAIANTSRYVLDEFQNIVPNGIAGELYIGGEGVTQGYWNRSELSDERFVKDPFSAQGKLYRTGDKVCLRSDGELEYLGRLDSQVKIRGFRIELGEIETTMRKHDNIEDCALAIKEPVPGDVRLVAYIVWAGNPVTLTELRKFLKQWMPAHMIPQMLVDIDALPRTPNGKLDRKSLPDVFTSVTESSNFVEPNTDVSRWLAKTWSQVIGVNKVGLNDNFFDLGGHSLLSMQVIHKVREEYNVSLSPRDLLLETLEQHANKIQPGVAAMDGDAKNNEAQAESEDSQNDNVPEVKKKKGFMSRLFK